MTKPNGKNSKDSSAVRVQCSTQLPIRQAQTGSQRLAEAVAHGTLTSATLHTYSQAGPALDIEDLAQQMHRAGAEVVKGDVGRVERLLTYQFLTLNEMFNDLAQRERPDIIELKLILEADQQRLLLSSNQARPQLNGVALYRWNGLEGLAPSGNRVNSGAGDFEDWSLGVNFSVPLGLRAGRASLRQSQLLIRRDRANLDQGLHQMQHLLALSLRNLEQFYAQYERFQAVRRAARTNLEVQLAQYNHGLVQFIVVLQAIVDWGNSVSSEAQALSQYNTELARLEFQTGTILQSHGIFFFEERFRSIGPLGRLGDDECYPRSQPPSASVCRYQGGARPSEESFDLEDPISKSPSVDGNMNEPEIDLDEDVEFQKVDEDANGTKSDEEIDKILEQSKKSSRLLDFLKKPFVRR